MKRGTKCASFFLNQLQEFKMGLIGRSLLLMITIIVLFEGCSLFSEEENKTAFSSDAISSLDSIIKRNGILGGTIIAFNDTVLKQYSFGIAKLEQNIQWSDTTYFRIASISKFITTIAILQLIEQGSFSLDTDISSLLPVRFRNPAFPDIPITIRMLMNHTSTIKDSDKAFDFAKRSIFIDTIIKDTIIPSIQSLFSKQFNQHEVFLAKSLTLNNGEIVQPVPGSFFNYTNLNYVILAWILERVSGDSFAEYMQKHIFLPLNIRAGYTLQDLPENGVIATQYRYVKNKWIAEGDALTKPYAQVYKPLTSYKAGHNPFRFSPQAGLRIRANDLAMLIRNLLSTDTLLSLSMKEAMFSETWSIGIHNSRNQFNGLFQSWGLGAQILTNTPGKDAINGTEKQYIGHIGRANGAYATMFFNKQSHDGFIILLNGIQSIPSSDHGFLKCEKELMSFILNFMQYDHE